MTIDEWYANPPVSSCGHTVYPITDGMGGVLEGCYFCEICNRKQQKGEVMTDFKTLIRALYQGHTTLEESHIRAHWQTHQTDWLRLLATSPYALEQRPTDEDSFVTLWLKVDRVVQDNLDFIQEFTSTLFTQEG